jgi:hypothetical protein
MEKDAMHPKQVRIPVRIMETDQGKENFTRQALDHLVEARVLSFRSQEAQDQSLPNQDYVRLVCRKDIASLCFCVCDGVGSSYKGDFAAHYLADHLINWLQGLPYRGNRPWQLSRRLKAHLNQLSARAQAELAALKMPDDTPPLVQEVMEELCTNYGSETVFFCGRLDYDMHAGKPSAEMRSFPLYSAAPIRALFFWMGNVTARLFETTEQYTVLGDSVDDSARWSTLRGCRGKVRSWNRSLSQLERLTVYTDGFDVLGPVLAELDDDECLEYAQQLLSLPTSDDMTALDLHWHYTPRTQPSQPQQPPSPVVRTTTVELGLQEKTAAIPVEEQDTAVMSMKQVMAIDPGELQEKTAAIPVEEQDTAAMPMKQVMAIDSEELQDITITTAEQEEEESS